MKVVYLFLATAAVFVSAEASFSLPVYDDFNTSAWTNSEAWTIQGNAEIQSETVHSGSGALQVDSGTISRQLTSNGSSIWISFYAQITEAPATNPSVSSANTSVAFFVDQNQKLVVYDGQQTNVLDSVTMPLGQWVRFDIYCDYQNGRWMLGVNGANVAQNLSFYSNGQQIESLLVANNSSASVYFDELHINDTEPTNSAVFALMDLNENQIPDWWEMRYFPETGVTDPDALAENGMTLLDAYIAGIAPNDAEDVLEIVRENNNGRKLGWARKPGRIYDVFWTASLTDGFNLNEPHRTFAAGDDSEFEAEDPGFYKIRVRKP